MLLLPTLLSLSIAASSVTAQTYAPTTAACPSGLKAVRAAGQVAAKNQTLSPEEAAYVLGHRLGPGYQGYLAYYQSVQGAFPSSSKDKLPAYVGAILTSPLEPARPRLAIAASGGGYRAALYTAGGLRAFDSRDTNAAKAGFGGLLQASDRIAALSGGSWMLASLGSADFPKIPNLTQWWLASIDLLQPGADTGTLWTNIIGQMAQKAAAGFKVTFGDFWALALSRHFIKGTNAANFFDASSHGAGQTFSSFLNLASFKSFTQPLPIFLTNTRSKGQHDGTKLPGQYTPISNTVYEVTPFEFGSWDRSLSAFTPTKYLGTNVKNGAIVDRSKCVTGFDSAAFLTGTSSNLYAEYNVTSEIFFAGPVGPVISIINSTFEAYQPGESLDVSTYLNPFVGLGHTEYDGGYLDTDETELQLLDGGLDGAVTPYQPLVVPARKVDVIIGLDGSGDTADGFASGGNLIASQTRAELFAGAYPFPKVPREVKAFGLASRPTFFGCEDTSTPLIVMIGNAAPIDGSVAVTNTSTSQIQYSDAEVSAFLDQTFTIATRGFPSVKGATKDPLWSACLACAIADRARARLGVPRSGVCVPCFQRYCWDGQILV